MSLAGTLPGLRGAGTERLSRISPTHGAGEVEGSPLQKTLMMNHAHTREEVAMRATRTVPGIEADTPDIWGRVTMPFAKDSHTDARRRQTAGGMMTDAAHVVLREGAETLGVTHMEALRDAAEAEASNTDEERNTEEAASEALLMAALVFAGYLHKNAEPMFLHALRVFFQYQEFACIGCRASTQVVTAALAVEPPSQEELDSLVDTGEAVTNAAVVGKRLMEALRAMEAGVPFEEVIANMMANEG